MMGSNTLAPGPSTTNKGKVKKHDKMIQTGIKKKKNENKKEVETMPQDESKEISEKKVQESE